MSANNISVPYFLADSLKEYSEDFYVKDNQNPFLIHLNGRDYSIHASEIHDSGSGRTNPDEWRIQLQSSIKRTQLERHSQGVICLYIGFFPDGKVFSAWEPDRVRSLNSDGTGSVYIPNSDQQVVSEQGFALRFVNATLLKRLSPEISLPINCLGMYIENHVAFQKAENAASMASLLKTNEAVVIFDQITTETAKEIEEVRQREKLVTTRLAFTRDPKFRQAVMQAYGGSCCICGRQLLLVQAAHIIPHSHHDCLNHVSNGLALCIEHHRLYDDALLLPTSNQLLHLNENRVEHLQNIGQDAGIDQLRNLSKTTYKVPEHGASQPNNEFLERGVHIRLGTDA